MMKASMNRRKFLTVVTQAAGVAFFSGSIAKGLLSNQAEAAEPVNSGTELKMLDPKDPLASAVKYVEDFKKSPTSKGNRCASCQFYAKKEKRIGKEVGTCTIFQGRLVYSNAFCNSYNKKV